MERIAVIPAKKRSKRCKGKNWRPFYQEKSLTKILVEKCELSDLFDRIVVSVDFDPSIAQHSALFNEPMGYFRVRPWWYRRWMSSAMVLQDVLEVIKCEPDSLYFFMQPTSPFLSIKTMKDVAKMLDTDTHAIVTGNPAYKPNGAIYAGRIGAFLKNPTFWPYPTFAYTMNWLESIDIDYEHDFMTARQLFGELE